MLSIGEFSRVTQLTIKALRLYHEKGILIPDRIDYDSKYRYYRSSAVEKALVIKRLKDMGFSLQEIKEIVQECSDDTQVAAFVEKKLQAVEDTLRQYMEMKQNLSLFLQRDKEEQIGHEHTNPSPAVETENIPGMLTAGIRFKGKYPEVGYKFGTLFKAFGRYARGKPFTLYYDGEYKEEGGDIEACIQVKKNIDIEGIDCRELKGGKAVTLIHRGPYEELHHSYGKIYEYCREYNLKILLPTREQYLKGPGMIFRGNPRKYITKLILFYEK
jgi:DNA-binding transcriptional MerR regulator/DNA gyrase inhibitor GyrI